MDELGLETYDILQAFSFWELQEKISMWVTTICKSGLSINVNYVNKVGWDVTCLKACEVIFGDPYLWDRK